jgi:very-short-patch-repair endonuclease
VDLGRALERTGIARTRELRQQGFSPAAIAAAVHTGAIIRLRIGWFGSPDLPDATIRAHRVGGPPACATVASLTGLWMLQPPILHVEVVRGDSRFRSQSDPTRAVPMTRRDDVVLHWVEAGTRSSRRGQPLSVALRHMTTCVTALEAVCSIDSALNRELVTMDELRRGAGSATLRVLDTCDAGAGSGVESVFRLRASPLHFPFRTQVKLPGGRVDFLFGERLIVEVDGAEYHAGRDAFVADRERDALHAALGYFVLRFTYEQVVRRWHEVESVLRLVHARGDQFWPSRIRIPRRHAG